jgi:hypothetical protein
VLKHAGCLRPRAGWRDPAGGAVSSAAMPGPGGGACGLLLATCYLAQVGSVSCSVNHAASFQQATAAPGVWSAFSFLGGRQDADRRSADETEVLFGSGL